VVTHIVTKTDGVPLYVEELTKMFLASDLLHEEADQYVLTGPLAAISIPETLQDSLMARLDQLNAAKEIVQLGAVLGREFSYEMLKAIAQQDEATVQSGLTLLVEAELLYQRGRPPRSRHLFKHALIQEAAYQSLLKSTRQQVHHQVVQLLEECFPEIRQTQPEMLAHHYSEAGSHMQAANYRQWAGRRAAERSAYREAASYLVKALNALQQLPENHNSLEQALDLQLALRQV
jgi:predicted ATPase